MSELKTNFQPGEIFKAEDINATNAAVNGKLDTIDASHKLAASNVSGLHSVATSGNYSELNGKPTIPAALVNSDWNAVSGIALILNKPTIPTVSDATITLKQGSATKGSFTLNQSGNVTITLDEGGSGGASIISVTYAELKTLRDNSQLVPGQKYRINDYETWINNNYTEICSMAGEDGYFDLIVEAQTTNTLCAIAYPIAIDREGRLLVDTRVNGSFVKYSLDNDTTKYPWCDANGKGVIYYMQDKNNNVCNYDFHSILFKRYKITSAGYLTILENQVIGVKNNPHYQVNTSEYQFWYTFTYLSEGQVNPCHDNTVILNFDNNSESGVILYTSMTDNHTIANNKIVGSSGIFIISEYIQDNDIESSQKILLNALSVSGNKIKEYNEITIYSVNICNNNFIGGLINGDKINNNIIVQCYYFNNNSIDGVADMMINLPAQENEFSFNKLKMVSSIGFNTDNQTGSYYNVTVENSYYLSVNSVVNQGKLEIVDVYGSSGSWKNINSQVSDRYPYVKFGQYNDTVVYLCEPGGSWQTAS